MVSKNLTPVSIERLARPAPGKRVEISDVEKGLFLHVSPSGSKRFVVIYRKPTAGGKSGPREKIALGTFPAMGIAQAREKAREVAATVAKGQDPKSVKTEKAIADRAESFTAVAEAFVAAMKAGKLTGGRTRPVTPETAADRESKLRNHVLPAIGSLPLKEVTPRVVGRLLTELEAKGRPSDNVMKVIRNVFSFAASRAMWSGLPPTSGMKKRQPVEKTARVLADAELAALWRAAEAYGYPFGHCLQMLMLTGQRRDEIAEAEWSWIDWDRKLLTVPGPKAKNRKGDHEVPLSDAALTVLTEAKAAYDALGLSSGFVFTSTTGRTPISGWAKTMARIEREVRAALAGISDAEMRSVFGKGAQGAEARAKKAEATKRLKAVALPGWRLHDLRHSFITRARDGEENSDGEVAWSAPLDVVQATVNHEISSGITKVYDHGDLQRRYRVQKRSLLDWWARKLETIVSGETTGAKILPLRRG